MLRPNFMLTQNMPHIFLHYSACHDREIRLVAALDNSKDETATRSHQVDFAVDTTTAAKATTTDAKADAADGDVAHARGNGKRRRIGSGRADKNLTDAARVERALENGCLTLSEAVDAVHNAASPARIVELKWAELVDATLQLCQVFMAHTDPSWVSSTLSLALAFRGPASKLTQHSVIV